MQNPFLDRVLPLNGPATDILPVTPSDSEMLPAVAVSLYVEGAGSVAFEAVGGEHRIVALPAFASLPVGVRQVLATGTTATGIHALVQVPVQPVQIVLVNTTAPALSGTPKIGQVLACSSGNWTGGSAPVLAYQWLRDGAAIDGAMAETYMLVPDDDGCVITCRVTATEGSASTSADAVGMMASHDAPTIAGTLADRFYTPSSGVQTLLTAAAFAGAALSFGLAQPVAGVVVDAETGDLTVTPGATGTLITAPVTVRAANSGGYADVTFHLTVTASALQPETEAFVSTHAQEGGTAMSTAQAAALDAFYGTAVASTWWSKVHRLFVGGLHDPIAGSIDLADQTTRMTQAGTTDMTWAVGQGWSAENVDDRALDMAVDPAAVTSQNDIGLVLWYHGLSADFGPDMGDEGPVYVRFLSDGSARARLHCATNANASGLATGAGFRMVNRTGSNPIEFYGPAGTLMTTESRSSETPVAGALYLGAAGGIGATSDRWILVNGLTSTLLPAEVLELRNALAALLAGFQGEAAPLNFTKPTITGTATVGSTLSAAPGAWDAGTTALAFQWERDGVAIGGAVGASHVLVPDDAGAVLRVVVTGSNLYFSTVVASDPVTVGPHANVPAGLVYHPAKAATPADQLAGFLAPTGWGDTLDGATIDYLDRLDWSGAEGSMKQLGTRASNGKWSFVIPTVGGTVNVLDAAGVMARDLTWYAFECGPGQGVEFVGNELRVTSSNTMIGHGKFRPGPSGNPDDTDAFNVRGGSGDVMNVKLYNCSFEGSNDESVGIDASGDYITHLSFVDCLLGYPITNRDDHIFGPYFLDGAYKSEFVRSMLVGFRRRCFGVEVGSIAGAWGCLMVSATEGYVTGRPIHFVGTNSKVLPGGHVYEYGADADGCVAVWNPSDPSDDNVIAVISSAPGVTLDRPIQIYRGQNAKVPTWETPITGYESGDPTAAGKAYVDERTAPNAPSVHPYWTGEDTRTNVPIYAGARPAFRDGLDTQLIDDAYALNLGLRTSLPAYSFPQVTGSFVPVADPFALVNGVPRIVWQIHDEHHVAQGGIPFL